jgi:preprotein translocase subunit SecD
MKSSEPFHQRVLKSIHMPNLKLGIDLQGGSYLVYGVEVEKALEKRLFIEKTRD